MAIAPLNENDILTLVYSAYENDNTTWSSTSAEYLTARNLCKEAIARWAYVEGGTWDELFSTLTAAADGTKTTTAGTYTYGCPTDMRIPPQPEDYVRIVNSAGASSHYRVMPLSKVQQLDDLTDRLCWFTGNPKLGYTLNINSGITLTTGDTITYEYYKNPTYLTTTTSTTEMANPYYIVHFVLYRMYKSDGLLNESREELQMAEDLLDEMKAMNTSIIADDRSEGVIGFGV